MNHTAWLEDFLTLLSSGNFSTSAKLRHSSQSAFSRRIQALEEWVGEPLFERTPHKVIPTQAGEAFFPAVNDAFNIITQGVNSARQAAHNEDRTLKIAATHALSLIFFPNWLREHETSITFDAVQLLSDTLTSCKRNLHTGSVDFFLGHQPLEGNTLNSEKGLLSTLIGTDQLVQVCAPELINTKKNNTGTEIPYLAYAHESGLSHILTSSSTFQDLQPLYNTVFSSHLASVIKVMAIDAKGVAWLPHSLIENELQSGLLQPYSSQQHNLDIGIYLTRKTQQLSKHSEALWSIADQEDIT